MASVQGEINRIATAKSDIESAIEYCGVDVPNTALISTYADYIRAIPTTIFSQLNYNSVGGTDKYIESISQSNGIISAATGGLATTSKSGLMSKADKAKLDNIAEGADSVSFSQTLTSGVKIGSITISGTTTNLYCRDTWVANAVNTAGYVSAPTTSNANMVWKCDAYGNPGWRVDSDTWIAMSGATATANGTAGYVPRPIAGKQNSFLKGNGTWDTITAASSGSHTHTFTGTAHKHTFTGTSHNHTFTGTAHNHTFTGTSHTHTFTGDEVESTTAGGHTPAGTNSTTGKHKHTFTASGTNSDAGGHTPSGTNSSSGKHKHTYTAAGTNSNAGGHTPSGTISSSGSHTPSGTVTLKGSESSGVLTITATFSGSAVAAHSHTFTGSAVAAHTHTFTGTASQNTSEVDDHTHTFTGNAVSAHTHTFTGTSSQSTSETGNHTHTFTGTAVSGHTHEVTATGSIGNTTAGGTIGNKTATGTIGSTTAGGTISNTTAGGTLDSTGAHTHDCS
jgi:hypothetical protein